MILARMNRPIRVLLITSASAVIAALASACGTEKITVAKSDATYGGAILFSQRCGGCHTLAFAATRGSATNERTAEPNNGPNFDVRCERPVARVLYAIENGGFSGLIMPQNVVVGKDAVAVAEFVAKYAGRQAPPVVGQVPCDSKPVGSIPATATTTTTTASSTGTLAKAPPGRPAKAKATRPPRRR